MLKTIDVLQEGLLIVAGASLVLPAVLFLKWRLSQGEGLDWRSFRKTSWLCFPASLLALFGLSEALSSMVRARVRDCALAPQASVALEAYINHGMTEVLDASRRSHGEPRIAGILASE